MEAVFLKLLNMSITAGWLILAVVILRFVFKKAPKNIRCLLWAFVAIRLLCPFSIESFMSLIPSAETIPVDIGYEQVPRIHSGVDALNRVVNPILAESLAPTTEMNSVNPIQIVTWVASQIWILGMVCMLIYSAVSYLRLKRKVAVSVPLRDVISEETLLFADEFHTWKKQSLGMDFDSAGPFSFANKYSGIFLCDYIDTPFILGIFRPRIYLPSNLDFEKAFSVIAHEEAHLKRRDYWWKPLGFLLLTIYWFNPLIWLAYILLCQDIELACDEKVIREMNEQEKKAYSEALLSCSHTRRYVAACPLAFGEVGVKNRIRSVLNYKKPAFWLMAAAIAICIITAACFLTNPKKNEIAPAARTYIVEHIIYDAPQFSFTYTTENYPIFGITPQMELRILENRESGEWLTAGTFEEVTLTEDNFDVAFVNLDDVTGFYRHDISPREQIRQLREENEKAWKLNIVDENYGVVYHFLEQENGDAYMIQGSYLDVRADWDEKETSREYGTNMLFRWVFKLIPGTVEDAEARANLVETAVALETTAQSDTDSMDWNQVAESELAAIKEKIGGMFDDVINQISASEERLLYNAWEADSELLADVVSEGYNTLYYCFDAFSEGEQTGLRGLVMAKVCEDILQELGFGFHFNWMSFEPATGQDWFDALYTHLTMMRFGISEEYMEKDYRDSWELLQLIEEGITSSIAYTPIPQGNFEVAEVRYSYDLESVDRVIMDLPSQTFDTFQTIFQMNNGNYEIAVCENYSEAVQTGGYRFETLGECLPVILGEENFDDCFKRKDNSVRAMIQELKENNEHAWKVGDLYNNWNQALLLVQKDGSIYMLLPTAYDGNGSRTGDTIYYDRVLKLKERTSLTEPESKDEGTDTLADIQDVETQNVLVPVGIGTLDSSQNDLPQAGVAYPIS